MTVDLTGLVPASDPRVRIATTMRIYWDRARVMAGGERTELAVTRIAPVFAELRFGGFPRPVSADGAPPFGYDPGTVAERGGWKAHAGRYSAFGDVLEPLAQRDDRFVTTRNGDEIELRFPRPEGPGRRRTRTYLLFADGFGKDMDPNSAASDEVAPLPFHGMPSYPYPDDVTPPVAARDASGAPPRIVSGAQDGIPGALPQALVATVGRRDL
jgi:hypothetical protein